MFIRSLTAWGGSTFSVQAGEELHVTDEIGAARIAAGLAEMVDEPTPVAAVEPVPVAPAKRRK